MEALLPTSFVTAAARLSSVCTKESTDFCVRSAKLSGQVLNGAFGVLLSTSCCAAHGTAALQRTMQLISRDSWLRQRGGAGSALCAWVAIGCCMAVDGSLEHFCGSLCRMLEGLGDPPHRPASRSSRASQSQRWPLLGLGLWGFGFRHWNLPSPCGKSFPHGRLHWPLLLAGMFRRCVGAGFSGLALCCQAAGLIASARTTSEISEGLQRGASGNVVLIEPGCCG